MPDSRPPARDPEPNDLHKMGSRARLVNALRECGELADAVETFEGAELFDVLTYLDSLRLIMIENQNALIGLIRAEEGSPPVPRKDASQ